MLKKTACKTALFFVLVFVAAFAGHGFVHKDLTDNDCQICCALRGSIGFSPVSICLTPLTAPVPAFFCIFPIVVVISVFNPISPRAPPQF